MQILIDADALKRTYTQNCGYENCIYDGAFIVNNIDEQPTIDAIPISFIEEQIELCNLIGFKRGEECYMALIEDWREKNGAETD